MPKQNERPSRDAPAALPLFRTQSIQSQREPLHGPVTVLVPPGTWAAAALCITAVLLLGLAVWLVEVPQRTQAVGVLMPPEGFLRIVAAQQGRVTEVGVREGETVAEGQTLLRVTSDGGAVAPDSVPHARLRSLQLELALRRDSEREERRARDRRRRTIDARIGRVEDELQRAKAEIDLHDARITLLERRLERLASLAADGNVSRTELEEARLSLLEARAAIESRRRQSIRIEQERELLQGERASLADEAALRQIEQAIAREQLERQFPDLQANLGRALRASRRGVVARIMVKPGQPVEAGQTLVTLYRGAPELEAWLYVPSTQAGSLREGQPVELSFAAWPREMFGSHAAVVVSVSAIALLPSDLDVPLSLPGPVFEIRATLERQTITARGREWPLAAGTAVRAELVQQRYRLYEWLLRLERDQRDAADSPADA